MVCEALCARERSGEAITCEVNEARTSLISNLSLFFLHCVCNGHNAYTLQRLRIALYKCHYTRAHCQWRYYLALLTAITCTVPFDCVVGLNVLLEELPICALRRSGSGVCASGQCLYVDVARAKSQRCRRSPHPRKQWNFCRLD